MSEVKPKEIRVYKTDAGRTPFTEWLYGLKDKNIRFRVRQRLDRLTLGNYGDYKSMGEGLLEMRLQFSSGYRIYFGEVNNYIVLLLCAGDKSTQAKDIKLAKQYWQEFKKKGATHE